MHLYFPLSAWSVLWRSSYDYRDARGHTGHLRELTHLERPGRVMGAAFYGARASVLKCAYPRLISDVTECAAHWNMEKSDLFSQQARGRVWRWNGETHGAESGQAAALPQRKAFRCEPRANLSVTQWHSQHRPRIPSKWGGLLRSVVSQKWHHALANHFNCFFVSWSGLRRGGCSCAHLLRLGPDLICV